MGHTAITRARAYQKIKDRRNAWFKENGPCKRCGSWEGLELDHVDPKEKEHHAVWSWSDKRREAELLKCQALCNKCHKLKSAWYVKETRTGTVNQKIRKISDEGVLAAIKMRQDGMTVRAIAKLFGVNHERIVVLTNAPNKSRNKKGPVILEEF